MDIRHLQYIVEVVRRSSFTRAAEALHITQPTVSKMIKNLEDELGVELFVRYGKRVELTDAGKVMYSHAQHILNSFEGLTLELGDLTHLKKGLIRVGLPPMVGSSFFPGVMRRFREHYPGIEIQMVEDGSIKIESGIENGMLDVGVVLLPTNEQLFNSYVFVNEKLKLLVHPGHALAARGHAALAELSGEPFIMFREDFALHDRIISACRHAGFEPRVLFQSSQWDFISELVAANLGVAMLPERICSALDHERVCPIELREPEILWELAMIWRKEGYLSFAAREWIQFTRTLLEANKSTS